MTSVQADTDPLFSMHGPSTIEQTSTAIFERMAPRYIQQRYKPDARITSECVQENQLVRQRLCNGEPCAVMVVFPAEVRVNPAATNTDHFRDDRAKGNILALAVVTDSAQMHTATKLYFMYFQQAFPVKVFDEERDAHRWLLQHLAAAGVALL